jgi:amino acid transporter
MKRVEFKRNIGLFMAVMIGIGAMMGPGIFALPGELALMAGPLGILAYLAMGLLTVFTALNYCELGAAIPLAGGGYSFAQRLLPGPAAFLTGWLFWVGNTLACAMYALIFALTIQTYFWPGASIALLSVGTTLVFGAINLRGTAQALKVIMVMNLLELAVLLGVAILGIPYVEATNLTPFAPKGLGPLVPAMALVFVSFVGFDLITVASEEIINPAKTVPRAILITLGIGTGLYVLVVWVMMGAVHHTDLAHTEVPFIFVADRLFGAWGRWAAVTATIMASLSAFSVTLGASARIMFALSRDGHIPTVLSRLHPRFHTPHVALGVCALVVGAFSALGGVKLLASIAGFGYLLGLGIVNISALVLRRRMPSLRRRFQVRFFPLVPVVAIASCWFVAMFLDSWSLLFGSGLTVVGVAAFLVRPAGRAELARLPALFDRLRLVIQTRGKKRMRVLIIGGGQQGQNIAKRLVAKDEYRLVFRQAEHQLTFIEEDEARCRELEQRFNVPVYQGDGTKKELLDQVGLESIDVVIAATRDDGRNLIVALQTKRLGIRQVIAVVQDADYVPLLEENDIVPVSAPWATAALVENYLDRPGVVELFEIGAGETNLVGVIVPEKARVAGKLIRELSIPRECVVAAIIRDDVFVVPRGDTTVHVADHVLFVGTTGATKTALDDFMRTD